MLKPFLEAGEFVTTHGINGELRLYPWCDEPAFLTRFATLYLDDAGKKPLPIAQMRPHKNLVIAKLAGIDSIEAARPYIGKTVYLARADAALEDGAHFVQDLLGATVRDAATGVDYGTIKAITHPGRHDVYEIETPGGETHLFPAAPPFMERIDVENGLVLIKPIEGMFP
ncbi:ribosome maturation factor RimM [Ruminococcaceae bacterium OttesenSCG-928-D13]|nr:ribosome maturation factor RimM [Ruminococcaceae bacterium OttesenSCG-928-D13]